MKFLRHDLLALLQRKKVMNSMSSSSNNKQQGFTLIEIMVAMAIMALISVGALAVLNKATNSNDYIKRTGDRLNNVQRAFMFISRDMQQLTLRQVRD